VNKAKTNLSSSGDETLPEEKDVYRRKSGRLKNSIKAASDLMKRPKKSLMHLKEYSVING